MANEPKTNTQEIERVVKRVLEHQDYVTLSEVEKVIALQTQHLEQTIANNQTEILGLKTQLGNVRELMISLDEHVRRNETTVQIYNNGVSEIKGVLGGIRDVVNKLDSRLERYGEENDKLEFRLGHLERSVLGNPPTPGIPSLIDLVTEQTRSIAALNTSITVKMEGLEKRVEDVEGFTTKHQRWEDNFKNAARTVFLSPKYLLAGVGGGTALSLLIEFLKALINRG